jgi:ubiquinone/menaquinone biosynthesis C-methylase UbiE
MTNQQNDRYDSTRNAWENIWDGASMEVELEAVQSARAQETIQAYLPYLSKDDIHIEAGSGLSAVVITLRQMGYTAHGLDYAVNALVESQRYDASLPLVAGDIHHLPYPDNTFGSYLSFGVLEHFEHGMQPALKEAYRILKPGGILVLTIPYPNLVYKLVQFKRRMSGDNLLTDDEFYESTYTRQQLIDNVSEVGFEVVSTQPTSHAFTLWGLGSVFRADGYYKTTPLAESIGSIFKRVLPWQFNFMTLTIGRK